MEIGLIPWALFVGFVLLMLAVDLGIFNRKEHTVGFREALTWSAVWISLALVFNVWLYFWLGPQPALEFLAGYLIEKSLSVDNLFVFLMVFSYFRVQSEHQHKILFWGILGALVMRAIFIFAGVALIERFHWVTYLFGAFLVFTGIKMARPHDDNDIDPEKNPLLKLVRRFVPVASSYKGSHFFIREGGKLMATPMLLVLIVIETTDLVFAVDSIPAILAITPDPFIVFTSNVFAILGLRALYFALAGVMRLFHYIHYGLSAVLIFVGIKMLIAHYYKIPIGVSLGVIGGILTLSVLASIKWPKEADDVELVPENLQDQGLNQGSPEAHRQKKPEDRK